MLQVDVRGKLRRHDRFACVMKNLSAKCHSQSDARVRKRPPRRKNGTTGASTLDIDSKVRVFPHENPWFLLGSDWDPAANGHVEIRPAAKSCAWTLLPSRADESPHPSAPKQRDLGSISNGPVVMHGTRVGLEQGWLQLRQGVCRSGHSTAAIDFAHSFIPSHAPTCQNFHECSSTLFYVHY